MRFPLVTSPVLDQILPICFCLVDSHDVAHQALGGTALLHLMAECTPTSLSGHGEAAARALKFGCMTCRDGPALAVLSRARSELFARAAWGPGGGRLSSSLSSPGAGSGAAERRTATSDLLGIVRLNSRQGPGGGGAYGDGDSRAAEGLVVGVLVGGIGPLLRQHADLPGADAMELVRPGLAALLPLMRWDYDAPKSVPGRSVQIAALSCLTSLMMGAHPAMPGHGGKAMAELLGCVGRADRYLARERGGGGEGGGGGGVVPVPSGVGGEETVAAAEAVLALALHVASVALVLCGDRAEAVLRDVTTGDYDPALMRRCEDIRDGAAELRRREDWTMHRDTAPEAAGLIPLAQ